MTSVLGLLALTVMVLAGIAHELIALQRQRIRHRSTEQLAGVMRPGMRIAEREPDGRAVELIVADTADPTVEFDRTETDGATDGQDGVRG